jgi:hypothetical protein
MEGPRTQLLRAFDQVTKTMIDALPNEIDEGNKEEAMEVVRELAYDIGADASKLSTLVLRILQRALGNIDWINAAAMVLAHLTTAMSSVIEDVDYTKRDGSTLTGGAVVRGYVLFHCRDIFQDTMMTVEWNASSIRLQTELLNRIFSPSAVQHLQMGYLTRMIGAEHIFSSNNFNIFIDYVRRIGPEFDHDTTRRMLLSSALETLGSRVAEQPFRAQLPFFGLLRMRERDWEL